MVKIINIVKNTKMKIVLLTVGKTNIPYIIEGIEGYQLRLNHYIDFETHDLLFIKKKNFTKKDNLLKFESQLILKFIESNDYVVLLDVKGNCFSSTQFSNKLQKIMLNSTKRLIFVIGGAYGFSEDIYQRANETLSLSRMTFSHQMVRLIFIEQLYRAFTILNNHPYHHK